MSRLFDAAQIADDEIKRHRLPGCPIGDEKPDPHDFSVPIYGCTAPVSHELVRRHDAVLAVLRRLYVADMAMERRGWGADVQDDALTEAWHVLER